MSYDSTEYDRWVGSYGRDWRSGVCVDHLCHLPANRIRSLASGKPVFVASGGFAYPIVCGAIIEVYTEDGPISGRCGIDIDTIGSFACSGHEQERNEWSSMSESEKAHWEQENEQW